MLLHSSFLLFLLTCHQFCPSTWLLHRQQTSAASQRNQLSCTPILCQKPFSYLHYFKANLSGRGGINSLLPLLGYHQQHNKLLEIITTTCIDYHKFSQSLCLDFCLTNIWLLSFSGTTLQDKLNSETYICLWKTRIIKILLKVPK